MSRVAVVRVLHAGQNVDLPTTQQLETVGLHIMKLAKNVRAGFSVRTSFDVTFQFMFRPQHFLYFFPLPHGQGSLRPTVRLILLLSASSVGVWP